MLYNFCKSVLFVLPVLREDKKLLGVVELLQDVGQELAPPPLASTQLHQQQTSMQTDLRSSADAQLLKELLTRLGVKRVLQH